MPRLLIFLAFMAAGTGMMYLLTVREAPRGGPAPTNLPFNVIVMTDVAVQQQEQDDITLQLWAKGAVFNERTERVSFRAVRFNAYRRNDEGRNTLFLRGRARKAKFDKKAGTLVMTGDVRVVDLDGTEIRSERMEYDRGRGQIMAPGPVWVKARESVHQGDSMVYEIEGKKITFTVPLFYQ